MFDCWVAVDEGSETGGELLDLAGRGRTRLREHLEGGTDEVGSVCMFDGWRVRVNPDLPRVAFTIDSFCSCSRLRD